MSSTRQRARDLLPNILLTLLSIVQALALETFWDGFQSSEHLWLGGWPALLGWMQAVIILLGITEIWLFYVSLILRFTWVPGIRDMVLPFVIGLLQFTLVDLQGVEQIGHWLICLSILFAVVITESHLIFRQARRDPSNQAFFKELQPAAISDFVAQIVPVLILVASGIVVIWTASQSWLALASLVFALAGLAWQVRVTSHYWKVTISGTREERGDSLGG